MATKNNGNGFKIIKKIRKPNKNRELVKSAVLYGAILLIFVTIFFTFSAPSKNVEEVPFSQVLAEVKNKQVKKIDVNGDTLNVFLENGKEIKSRKEPNLSLVEALQRDNLDPSTLNITVKDDSGSSKWLDLIGSLLPILLMVGFFLLLMRQARGASDSIFSFGKSRARIFSRDKPNVTFADVAGVEEAKRELSEIVDFLKEPEKFRKLGARTPKGVLLLGPAGVGKCVTGETQVLTTKGLVRIKDIPKYFAVGRDGRVWGAEVISVNPKNVTQMISQASYWYSLGRQQTLRLETTLGFEVEGTYEHPVVALSRDGNLSFKRLDEAKTGDFVAIKYGDQVFGSNRELSTEKAYLMGILVGDGGLTTKDRLSLTTSDEQILLFAENFFKEEYGYQIRKATGPYDYNVSNREIKNDFLDLGLTETYSSGKKVPESILFSEKKVVTAFLQGLFDSDGSVTRTGKVEWTSTSKTLAAQVSNFLLNLGIVHKFRRRGLNQFAYAYSLQISGDFLLAFAQEVGFRLERKAKILTEYLENHRGSNTNINLFPYQGQRIGRIWDFLVRTGSKPSLAVDAAFHKDILRYKKGERKPSYHGLNKFLLSTVKANPAVKRLSEFQFLENLVKGGLIFVPIKRIFKSAGEVYDFTVPNSHNFVANGFINHNTLLARALAGEAGVPFFSMAGSEFMEMLVGVGASRVRDLFETAKRAAPSIIFIDEIESIGRHRGMGMMGGHDEREQTLNQILVEMDGFEPNTSVVVVAATNRPNLLDPALIRPGRFDRQVRLDLPDIEGRQAILQIHMRGKPVSPNVDMRKLAKRTVGFSGADLENMLNEAAILAARAGKKEIDPIDLEEAATKVKLGPEKRRLQSEEDKKMTAYHEAGHALVSSLQPHMDPVHRISIVSRGLALGFTMIPPSQDRYNETRTRFLEQIATMLGGRAAEEIVFNEMTAGAGNDIDHASRVARAMVMEYGMSELGPMSFNLDEDARYILSATGESSSYSEEMAKRIDLEVKRILDDAFGRAKSILSQNRDKLDAVVRALMEKETLESEEFERIIGKTPPSQSVQPALSPVLA